MLDLYTSLVSASKLLAPSKSPAPVSFRQRATQGPMRYDVGAGGIVQVTAGVMRPIRCELRICL